MQIAKDEIVAALGLRYDYHSAATMFDAARTRAELADKSQYDAGEVAAFRAALARIGDRLDKVNARLDVLTGATAPAASDATAEAAKLDVPKPDAPRLDDVVADTREPKSKKKAEKSEQAEARVEAGKPDKADKPVDEPKRTKRAKSDETQPVPTIVAITGVDLKDGEELLVCGDFVKWDLEQARPMVRVGDHQWLGTIDTPIGNEVSFKFLRKTAGGEVMWEPGENRTLVGGTRLDVKWGDPTR